MLRAHLVDAESVSTVCKRFGVSRQTFYKLQEKFLDEGTTGLLPKQPGPKGASKLTADVLSFVKKRLERHKPISTSDLLAQVEKKFGLSFHKRTLEKLITELHAKKTRDHHLEPSLSQTVLQDPARLRYESLRLPGLL